MRAGCVVSDSSWFGSQMRAEASPTAAPAAPKLAAKEGDQIVVVGRAGPLPEDDLFN